MSIDVLQTKIRKLKCPIVLDLALNPEQIPSPYTAEHTQLEALSGYIRALMAGLQGVVPGVRFCFDQFALLGAEGMTVLSQLLQEAAGYGFYVLLDGPAVLTPWAAQRAASLLAQGSSYPCDGLIMDPYIGADAIRPFVDFCKEGKSLFLAVRTPNRSAAELQDLMTGPRLVHIAAADAANRHGETVMGRCGYSQIGVLTAATSASAVSGLRNKYNRLFLLVDGLDYPGGNGKNVSLGFDRFGHGCAMSVGPEITAAWMAENAGDKDPVELARKAAERVSNNMARYITIL